MFNSKKRFFRKKIDQVEKMVWDLEFKLFKLREMREERRMARDRAVETVQALDNELPKDLKQETKDALLKERAEHQKHKDKIEKDLVVLDVRINGIGLLEGKPDDYVNEIAAKLEPGEYNGVLNQIEAGKELVKMYREYIRLNL